MEPFIPLLWLKVRELLGRVPEGSTARFVKDGTLPVDRHSARPSGTGSPAERSDPKSTDHPNQPLRRRGLAPGGDLFTASRCRIER